MERVAVEELGHAFGVDRVLLRRIEGANLGPVTSEWHEIDVDPMGACDLQAVAATGSRAQAERLWADVEVQTYSTVGRGTPTSAADEAMGDLALICDGQAVLVAGFGAGIDAFGTLTLLQLRQPREWSQAEVAAIEAIAADLGRALQHATLYSRERALVEQLRELDRTKSDFLSTISHELRTPLTSITGYIELLREGAESLTAGQARMLDVIERNGYRLSSLIEDLLTMSRIESGAVSSQRVPVDITSLVHNACADVRPGALEAGLRLEVSDGPSGTQVTGDPGQLDRVLLNLLSNAVKFTPSGGRVRVEWHVMGDDVVLAVTDTGIGIPESEAHQLSTRFFRASNAMSAAIPGTGLGLTIVRGILEIHHGELVIDSSPTGTRATVRLPVARREAGDLAPWGTSGQLTRL